MESGTMGFSLRQRPMQETDGRREAVNKPNALLAGILAVGISLFSAPWIYAAEGEEDQLEAAATPEGQPDYQALAAELSAQGYSQDEVADVLEQAYGEVAAGAAVDGSEGGQALAEGAPLEGALYGGPTAGGTTAGGTQANLTPQEQALMETVGSQVKELAGQGLTEQQVHEAIEAQFGDQLREAAESRGIEYGQEHSSGGLERAAEQGGYGHEQGEQGGYGREQQERGEHGGYVREQSERGSSEREHGGDEREQAERGSVEREQPEQPEQAERSSVEREQPEQREHAGHDVGMEREGSGQGPEAPAGGGGGNPGI